MNNLALHYVSKIEEVKQEFPAGIANPAFKTTNLYFKDRDGKVIMWVTCFMDEAE